MRTRLIGKRRDARLWLVGLSLTLALLVRAVVPVGFMPDLADPLRGFVICHGAEQAPPEAGDGGSAPESGASAPCPFAFLPLAAFAAAPARLAAPAPVFAPSPARPPALAPPSAPSPFPLGARAPPFVSAG